MKKLIKFIISMFLITLSFSITYAKNNDNPTNSISEYDFAVSVRNMSKEEALSNDIDESSYEYYCSNKIEMNLLALKSLSEKELTKYGYNRQQIEVIKEYNGERIQDYPKLRAVAATLSITFYKVFAGPTSYKIEAYWNWSSRPIMFGINEKGTAVLGWHAVDSNNLTSNACYIPSESSCTVNYYTGEGIFTGSLGQTIIVDDSYECVHVNHQSMYGYSSSGSLGFAKTGNLYVRTDSVTGATIEEMGYKFFYYYESASLSVSITFSWPSISVSSGMTLARNRACTLNKNGVLTQYSY